MDVNITRQGKFIVIKVGNQHFVCDGTKADLKRKVAYAKELRLLPEEDMALFVFLTCSGNRANSHYGKDGS